MKIANACGTAWFLAVVLCTVASGQVVFDFENEATSTTVRAFSMTESGITASFLDPGADSWIQQLNGPVAFAPPSWGARHFSPAVFRPNHQLIDFSTALISLSIEFGDFGGPGGTESDILHLRAWSGLGGTGVVVDADDVFYPGTAALPNDVGTASVGSGLAFLSLELWEDGSSTRNDISIDNLTVVAVPEPMLLPAISLVIAMLAGSYRR